MVSAVRVTSGAARCASVTAATWWWPHSRADKVGSVVGRPPARVDPGQRSGKARSARISCYDISGAMTAEIKLEVADRERSVSDRVIPLQSASRLSTPKETLPGHRLAEGSLPLEPRLRAVDPLHRSRD